MGSKNNYIIWFGSVFTSDTLMKNTAISPAGNTFQQDFFDNMGGIGVKTIAIGHCPERVFPFGRLFVNKKNVTTPENARSELSSYLNLPFIRILIINLLSVKKLARIIKIEGVKPLYVLSYNTYSYNVAPVLYAKYIRGIKWITIIADPVSDNTKRINPFNKLADAKMFFSYKLFIEDKSEKKIHFDGAVSKINGMEKKVLASNEKIILYAGTIAYHTGVELLVRAIPFVKSKNLKFIFCGRGKNDILQKASNLNKNISFLGLLDEEKLKELYRNAYVFINPRLISSETNISIFPSKLFQYLSYCKPVISTYTEGIHPYYKEAIQFIYQDDPQILANKIDEVVAWDENIYLQVSDSIKSFIEQKKMWPQIIKEIHTWALEI